MSIEFFSVHTIRNRLKIKRRWRWRNGSRAFSISNFGSGVRVQALLSRCFLRQENVLHILSAHTGWGVTRWRTAVFVLLGLISFLFLSINCFINSLFFSFTSFYLSLFPLTKIYCLFPSRSDNSANIHRKSVTASWFSSSSVFVSSNILSDRITFYS